MVVGKVVENFKIEEQEKNSYGENLKFCIKYKKYCNFFIVIMNFLIIFLFLIELFEYLFV